MTGDLKRARDEFNQPAEGVNVHTGKPEKSSAGRWAGVSKIWGKEGDHRTPYMLRVWIGRLRFHVFYRGDEDPDCHDHPWDFWTFPLTSYVEEVAVHYDDATPATEFTLIRRLVPALRLSYRPAGHTHRVIGPATVVARHMARPDGTIPGIVTQDRQTRPGRIVTVVWRGESKRKWGFLRNRDGRWCWTPWKDYVFGGGKGAPCDE